MGWRCWIIYRSPRFKKDHQTPNLRAVSCNWIIHYMWQLFPLEADWEINNQGIKSRTVQPLFLFPLWPITSAQFKHLQCHSSLWHFLARSHMRARASARTLWRRQTFARESCLFGIFFTYRNVDVLARELLSPRIKRRRDTRAAHLCQDDTCSLTWSYKLCTRL